MKYSAAVLTISDKGAKGERKDTSGPAVIAMLQDTGYEVAYYCIIPDEIEEIKQKLITCADELRISLILTTGGTGFSPRDVTPEATLAVIERETRGIPIAMCEESLKITPRGCLSRSAAGIRGKSLIVNLPGSEKAAKENLKAVIGSIGHGLDMLYSAGSADCAASVNRDSHEDIMKSANEKSREDLSDSGNKENCEAASDLCKKEVPSMDTWMKEAKRDPNASRIGMYLTHNGIVRETPKAKVRNGEDTGKLVTGMQFSYDAEKVERFIAQTKEREGIYYVRVWLNEGTLQVGDDIMYVMIGGDIRPRVIDALNFLVGKIKTECVEERELY